jgi:hypothetical protein
MPEDMPIQGPLGIWPFPIMNAIVMSQGGSSSPSVTEHNVVRDSQGRIERVEVIEGLGDG